MLVFLELQFINVLRKLEKSGLIAGSKFVINPKVLGYTTMAFVGIYLDKAISNPEAVKQLQKIPEVIRMSLHNRKLEYFYKNTYAKTMSI